ncbi:MAG: NrsF family protein [Acidobacteriia bacterium]|nr:NrsF family protein [Terriglobia bacterium]
MQDVPRPSDELRRAVAADLRPVRSLASPARRMLVAALWVPLAIALVLEFLGRRVDAPVLGWPMIWGPLVLEAALGLVLVALALAESVPARAPARGQSFAALGAAVLAFVAQVLLTRGASPGVTVGNPLVTHGLNCFALEVVVGLPALLLVALLVVRAAPLRAVRAGGLGGAGVGFLADGVYHLHCPITDLRHVLPWHGAAVLLLTLAGLAAGMAWERNQRRQMAERLALRSR